MENESCLSLAPTQDAKKWVRIILRAVSLLLLGLNASAEVPSKVLALRAQAAPPAQVSPDPIPLTIVTQPTNLMAFESYLAVFKIAAAGTPPIFYQWSRDSALILGATNTTYAFTAFLGDSGAVFSCTVANLEDGILTILTSSDATLTVQADTVTLRHRYSFREFPRDIIALDSVGDANAPMRGGANFDGAGKVTLDGKDSYVDLPNNIVTGYTRITIEGWVQDNGSAPGAHLFDFGNSTGGENFPPESTPQGTQYLYLAQPSSSSDLRGGYTTNGPGQAEQLVEWNGNAFPTGQLTHVVWVTHDRAHTGRLFVDGAMVGENVALFLTPADLGPTVNNWIGRSQAHDPLFKGELEEIRIWEGAMTPDAVSASYAAGPDARIGTIPLFIRRTNNTEVLVSWPAAARGFVLQQSTTAAPDGDWTNYDGEPPIVMDGFLQVTLPLNSRTMFFR